MFFYFYFKNVFIDCPRGGQPSKGVCKSPGSPDPCPDGGGILENSKEEAYRTASQLRAVIQHLPWSSAVDEGEYQPATTKIRTATLLHKRAIPLNIIQDNKENNVVSCIIIFLSIIVYIIITRVVTKNFLFFFYFELTPLKHSISNQFRFWNGTIQTLGLKGFRFEPTHRLDWLMAVAKPNESLNWCTENVPLLYALKRMCKDIVVEEHREDEICLLRQWKWK